MYTRHLSTSSDHVTYCLSIIDEPPRTGRVKHPLPLGDDPAAEAPIPDVHDHRLAGRRDLVGDSRSIVEAELAVFGAARTVET